MNWDKNREFIQEAIAKDDLNIVIKLLINFLHEKGDNYNKLNHLLSLQGQFHQLEKDVNDRTISYDDKTRTRNQIRKVVLETLGSIKKDTSWEKDIEEGIELEMILVEGGTFILGDERFKESTPEHEVTLDSFEIGKYLVTRSQWQKIMKFDSRGLGAHPNHPVDNISWFEIQTFLNKLNLQHPNQNYRLPTEAEWEFAARGGNYSKGFLFAGSNDPNLVGWFWKNSGDEFLHGPWSEEKIQKNNCRSRVVGRKKPNELGIYDFSGNLREWCWDLYGGYEFSPQKNPDGVELGMDRVVRGGSWYETEDYLKNSKRHSCNPKVKNDTLGFRIARNVRN